MDILQNIVNLFTTTTEKIEIKENTECVNTVVKFTQDIKLPSVEEFFKTISVLPENGRDYIDITLLRDGKVICDYITLQDTSSGQRDPLNFTFFLRQLTGWTKLDKDAEYYLQIQLIKSNKNNIISVYYPEIFIDYLKSKKPVLFLIELYDASNACIRKLTFEVQQPYFERFETKRFTFISKHELINSTETQSVVEEIEYRNKVIALHEIYNELYVDEWYNGVVLNNLFIPDDFYPLEKYDKNEKLKDLFSRYCAYFSVCFLEGESYMDKVNIDFLLKEENLDPLSYKMFYKEYKKVFGETDIKKVKQNLVQYKAKGISEIFNYGFGQDEFAGAPSTVYWEMSRYKRLNDIIGKGKISEDVLYDKFPNLYGGYVPDHCKCLACQNGKQSTIETKTIDLSLNPQNEIFKQLEFFAESEWDNLKTDVERNGGELPRNYIILKGSTVSPAVSYFIDNDIESYFEFVEKTYAIGYEFRKNEVEKFVGKLYTKIFGYNLDGVVYMSYGAANALDWIATRNRK